MLTESKNEGSDEHGAAFSANSKTTKWLIGRSCIFYRKKLEEFLYFFRFCFKQGREQWHYRSCRKKLLDFSKFKVFHLLHNRRKCKIYRSMPTMPRIREWYQVLQLSQSVPYFPEHLQSELLNEKSYRLLSETNISKRLIVKHVFPTLLLLGKTNFPAEMQSGSHSSPT